MNKDLNENNGCRNAIFGVLLVFGLIFLGCVVLVVGCVGMVMF